MELAHRDIEIEKLKARVDIFGMYMAEVKAIADGSTENTLSVVVDHCLEEGMHLHNTVISGQGCPHNRCI